MKSLEEADFNAGDVDTSPKKEWGHIFLVIPTRGGSCDWTIHQSVFIGITGNGFGALVFSLSPEPFCFAALEIFFRIG
jgi:hypothetical protein